MESQRERAVIIKVRTDVNYHRLILMLAAFIRSQQQQVYATKDNALLGLVWSDVMFYLREIALLTGISYTQIYEEFLTHA